MNDFRFVSDAKIPATRDWGPDWVIRLEFELARASHRSRTLISAFLSANKLRVIIKHRYPHRFLTEGQKEVMRELSQSDKRFFEVFCDWRAHRSSYELSIIHNPFFDHIGIC